MAANASDHAQHLFDEAASAYVKLVAAVPTEAYDRPGLGVWSVRELIGHTARALTTVSTYVARPADREQVTSAADYYLQVGAVDPAAVAERGRRAGEGLGDDPVAAVRQQYADATAALDGTTGDPLIETIAGGIRVSSYLPTRTTELTVHGLDLAAATGVDWQPAGPALTHVAQLLADIAVRKGDGPAVLRADRPGAPACRLLPALTGRRRTQRVR